MDILLIVVAIWVGLDIAIIAALSHVTRRREIGTAPPSLTPPTTAPSRSDSPRPVLLPLLVGDTPSPAPEPRLRAVSHR